VAFKRVSNILKGVEPGAAQPDTTLLVEPQEKALFEASRTLAPKMKALRETGDYQLSFETLASIKDIIDAFFDKVMVMAEDRKVRENRLALLNSIRDLYFRIADLSRLMA
jgi:glycyl-tRNA synthetase beta chain